MTRRYHKKKHVLPKRFRDANVRIPETLTDEVLSAIEKLPDEYGRKVQYLKEVFRSKYVSKDTDPAEVRRLRAITKWLAVERNNEATNDRLLILPEEYNILPRVTWSAFRDHARALIADLIGETVPIESLFGGFSGGATTTKSRTQSHPALKYLGKAEITPAARKWFDLVMEESPLWAEFSADLHVSEVPGNHMFTVPKSTEIDRVAAKEPDLNMYLQKGVGNHIRRRLRTVGINLNDQTRNQRLAREGSLTGRLATIDLSSASDSVTVEVVAALLPDLWFGLLSDLRSPSTLVDGEWHENHMFSSMGNGFTFELESLVFWAICKTVRYFTRGSGTISVYGDDLIVGTDYVQELIWVLEFVGFTVNTDKSHVSGPFRESCGGHYESGYDVSPFYIRKPLTTIRDAIVLANQIRKWSKTPLISVLAWDLEELWLHVKSHVPACFWGGVDLESDSQLVSTDVPHRRLVAKSSKVDNGLGGYLLWLDSCRGTEARDDAIVTSFRNGDDLRYEARRVKAEVRNPPDIFLSELSSG